MLVRHLQIQPIESLIWLVGWIHRLRIQDMQGNFFFFLIMICKAISLCHFMWGMWASVNFGILGNTWEPGTREYLGPGNRYPTNTEGWLSLKDEPRKGNSRISENQVNLCIDSKVRINTVETHKRLSSYSRPLSILGGLFIGPLQILKPVDVQVP